jgi:hypothetical protein
MVNNLPSVGLTVRSYVFSLRSEVKVAQVVVGMFKVKLSILTK